MGGKKAQFLTMIGSFEKEEMKAQHKMLGGRCSWRLLPGLKTLWKPICSRKEYDVDLLAPAVDCLQFFTSFELCAGDRSVFCHLSPRPAPPIAPQSLSQNLRRHRCPSHRPAQCCESFASWVMGVIYVSIDLYINCLHRLLLLASSRPTLY